MSGLKFIASIEWSKIIEKNKKLSEPTIYSDDGNGLVEITKEEAEQKMKKYFNRKPHKPNVIKVDTSDFEGN